MKQSDINRNSYNQIVSDWLAYRNKNVNTCIREFSELLPAGARVLDIGCGTGSPIDTYLCEKGFSVFGIDISEKMIAEAVKHNLPNARFVVKDFMDFQSNKLFDAVIAFDSIWHIEEERQSEIYEAVSRLLRPGGYFLFTHGREQGTVHGTMFSHEFVYSALDGEQVRRLLSEQDLEIVSWQEDYEEATTGTRDLLVVARKK